MGLLERIGDAFYDVAGPDMPVGTFGYVRGPCLAASDRFDLIVRGKSGHAAHPDDAVDPIVAAAHFVAQAQTVVSREIKPLHPAVVKARVNNQLQIVHQRRLLEQLDYRFLALRTGHEKQRIAHQPFGDVI